MWFISDSGPQLGSLR